MPRPAPIPPPKISPIERNGRVMLVDYDQGLEHGPKDFSETTIDPLTAIELAQRGNFTGIVLHKGIARSYYEVGQHRTPLIIKLNGKTNLVEDQDPYSPQVCSVAEAKALNAQAVGYTVYLGSQFEAQMFKEFAAVVVQAHQVGMPVIAWMLPRGKHIHRPTERDMAAYAARVGLELGADYVQLRFTGPIASFGWVVQSAGRCKVVPILEESDIETIQKRAKGFIDYGAAGICVGKSVWALADPLTAAETLSQALQV